MTKRVMSSGSARTMRSVGSFRRALPTRSSSCPTVSEPSVVTSATRSPACRSRCCASVSFMLTLLPGLEAFVDTGEFVERARIHRLVHQHERIVAQLLLQARDEDGEAHGVEPRLEQHRVAAKVRVELIAAVGRD